MNDEIMELRIINDKGIIVENAKLPIMDYYGSAVINYIKSNYPNNRIIESIYHIDLIKVWIK